MTAKLLDGRHIAQTLNDQTKAEIAALSTKHKQPPGLAVILVGDDPASTVYVRNKNNAAKAIGISTKTYDLEVNTTEQALLNLIDTLNADSNTHGILLQLPVPKHISKKAVIEHIDPRKDVDGFHPLNIGALAQRSPYLRPCTPYGVMKMLEHEKIDISGMNVTIVGASLIVGMPMALEVLNSGGTPTVCHKRTKDLAAKVADADCLIVATGNPGLIPAEWVKDGVIAIDVGINRLESGKLVGDLQFEAISAKASYITPVPGGVGPMTVAMLMHNTVLAYQGQVSS